MSGKKRPILAAALLWSACCGPALAQADVSKDLADPELVPGAHEVAAGLLDQDPAAGGKSATDTVIVPIPLAQPALGVGLAALGVLFRSRPGEPSPWVTGAGGAITSSGTWALGAFHRRSMGQDRTRFMAFAGFAKANFNYYGTGAEAGALGHSVRLEEQIALGLVEFKLRLARRGLLRRILVGPRIRFAHMDASGDTIVPGRPDLDLADGERHSHILMIGPAFTLDSRDNSFSPRKGVHVSGSWIFGTTLLGGDYTHRKLEILGNTYFPIGQQTVLGIRKSACSVSGRAPFYDQCLFGQHSDLRGYETGRYRDGATWALQAEVRQHLSGRFGGVAFFGVGGIASSAGDIWKHSYVLASGGLGVRYMASQANKVNLRLDLAIGRDGPGLYFGIGEAF